MKDIFQANLLCDKCNIKTDKKVAVKDGFKLRFFECPNCSQRWQHPTDFKEYQEFKELQKRHFDVKLRMVGNSFSVTIPREIIDFEEKFKQMEKEMDKMMRLSLEEPGKVSIYFRKLME
jgi:hypothetical protein